MKQTHAQRAEELKDTIQKLYVQESHSINYIAKLLNLNRKILSQKINQEWKFVSNPSRHHLTASNQKFLNKNRQFIKSKLDQGWTHTKIAKALGISLSKLDRTLIVNDKVLQQANKEYNNRIHKNAQLRLQKKLEQSSTQYIANQDNFIHEIWKPILGYKNYQVSNYGRIKKYHPYYKRWSLLLQNQNKSNNRMYVWLVDKNGKKHGLQVARLVGFAFCKGYSQRHNTIDHIDGNIYNNKVSNLRWV